MSVMNILSTTIYIVISVQAHLRIVDWLCRPIDTSAMGVNSVRFIIIWAATGLVFGVASYQLFLFLTSWIIK